MEKNKWLIAGMCIGTMGLFYFLNRLWYLIVSGQIFLLNKFHLFGPLSFRKDVLLMSFLTTCTCLFYLMLQWTKRRNMRKGEEHGSARWGTRKEAEVYIDPIDDQNILLSETERMTMNPYALKGQDPTTSRNKNVILIGGSGSGKTRFYVKPNLMQMHSNYIVTDPKGTLLGECGKLFQRGRPKRDKVGKVMRHPETGKIIYEPYHIKVFNTIDLKKSMRYNPFVYVHSIDDMAVLIDTLIKNTNNGKKETGGDPFWEQSERLLYQAYLGYLFATEEDKQYITFSRLLEMLNESTASEEDETAQSKIDKGFEDLEEKLKKDKDSEKKWFSEAQRVYAQFAVNQYKKLKKAAGKTMKSILITACARLGVFEIEGVKKLVDKDEMELDRIGDEGYLCILFAIISDTNQTYNFLVSILYTQMFQILTVKADTKYAGKLPIPVRFILDEFANIGLIPNFEILIGTIRSRQISASIILQTLSQLKALYKDHANTIYGNCDSFVFLGGREKDSVKDLEEMLGKETIETMSSSESHGRSDSNSSSFQVTGRSLMSMDEIGVMDGRKCIVSIRGTRPFFSNKYDICKHKRYRYLSDANPKNFYHFEPQRGKADLFTTGEEVTVDARHIDLQMK